MKLVISAFLLFIMGIACRLIACLDNRFASIGELTWFFLVIGAILVYSAFDSDAKDEEMEEESDDDETEKPKP